MQHNVKIYSKTSATVLVGRKISVTSLIKRLTRVTVSISVPLFVPIGGVVLTLQNSLHTLKSNVITLIENLFLSVNNSAHSLSSSAISLIENFILTIQNSSHSLISDNLVLTEASAYEAETEALVARIIAAGETVTDTWKDAMNTAIIASKAADLFATQFDTLVITRGFGDAQTKLNIITDVSNALGVNNPTRVDNAGYKSNGTTSYLRTQYTPSGSSLATQNDFCWGFKISGTVSTSISGHGVTSDAGNCTQNINTSASAASNRVNNRITDGSGSVKREVGYNCYSRAASNVFTQMVNAASTNANVNSNGMTALELYMLCRNHSIPYFTANTEVIEVYWMGKSMSQAKFLTFQSIWNTFFATYQ